MKAESPSGSRNRQEVRRRFAGAERTLDAACGAAGGTALQYRHTGVNALVSSATRSGAGRPFAMGAGKSSAGGAARADRVRGPVVGRPSIDETQPGSGEALERLVDPLTAATRARRCVGRVQSRAKLRRRVDRERLDGELDHGGAAAQRARLPAAIGAQEPRGCRASGPQRAVRAHQRQRRAISQRR